MTVSEKKPRQNTGNHPDPLTEYPEARKRLESCADYPNARRPDGVLVSTVRCDDLHTLLAGPPEPSEEEVARVDVQKAMHPVREYLLAMGTRQRFAEEAAERATDAAFALLSRSRRA